LGAQGCGGADSSARTTASIAIGGRTPRAPPTPIARVVWKAPASPERPPKALHRLQLRGVEIQSACPNSLLRARRFRADHARSASRTSRPRRQEPSLPNRAPLARGRSLHRRRESRYRPRSGPSRRREASVRRIVARASRRGDAPAAGITFEGSVSGFAGTREAASSSVCGGKD